MGKKNSMYKAMSTADLMRLLNRNSLNTLPQGRGCNCHTTVGVHPGRCTTGSCQACTLHAFEAACDEGKRELIEAAVDKFAEVYRVAQRFIAIAKELSQREGHRVEFAPRPGCHGWLKRDGNIIHIGWNGVNNFDQLNAQMLRWSRAIDYKPRLRKAKALNRAKKVQAS